MPGQGGHARAGRSPRASEVAAQRRTLRVDRPSTRVGIGRHPTDAGSAEGDRGDWNGAEGAGLPQLGSGHVRPELSHLLGEDGERRRVLGVLDVRIGVAKRRSEALALWNVLRGTVAERNR